MVKEMKRFCALLAVCAGVTALGACDTTPTTPTPTSNPITSATQVFSGSIVPGDTPNFTFSVPASSPLHIMFGSLTSLTGAPLGSAVRMTLGLQNTSNGCDALTSVTTTAALRAQINIIASAGAYCVQLTDTTGVPVPANFSVRLIYGTPSDASSAETITYSSTVAPGGFTARTFPVAAAGNTTIIMDLLTPASVPTLGLALGFPRQDGSGCEVTTAISAARTAQLTVPTDPGKYCVKIFDQGTLTDVTGFTIRIVHP